MPNWRLSGSIAIYAGLIITLAFPVAGGIPVLGYLAEIAAIYFIVVFAFYGRNLLLGTATFGSIMISSVFFGPSLLLVGLWAKVVVTGTIYGKMLAAGIKPARAFLTATAVMAAIILIIFWTERELIYSEINRLENLAIATLPQGAAATDANEGMAGWIGTIMAVFKRLLPSLVVLSGVTQFFVAIALLYVIFRSTGAFIPQFVEFVFWKMPFYFIYPTGLFIFMRLLGTGPIRVAADNCLLFMGVFYAVFGFAVMEYYLRKVRLSLFLRVLFYVGFVFLQVPGLMIAASVGLFDSYFDFRQIRARLIG